jgi:A/G-specific adenine glycosylase
MTIRNPHAQGSKNGPGQLPRPKSVATALEAWFGQSARNLPWRQRRSGYRALVSEVMLQQTQVQRVIPAFVGFMRKFPTIRALAAAPEQHVLAAWQGLGYYRRARLLHAAASVVVEQHAGLVPKTAIALRQLPGVGRYTAGAIASIVHGEREAIVDGNVFRVLSRLAARKGSADQPASMSWAWTQAERLARAAPNPGAANEALMELGALVCTPQNPQCSNCPLNAQCLARKSGTPETFPQPKLRAVPRTVYWHVLVVRNSAGVLLEQRGEAGLWRRMWQMPTVESARALRIVELGHHWGAGVAPVATFTHVTSHRVVKFRVYRKPRAGRTAAAQRQWVPLNRLTEFPMPNAIWKALQAAGVPISPPPLAIAPRRASRGGQSAAGLGS